MSFSALNLKKVVETENGDKLKDTCVNINKDNVGSINSRKTNNKSTCKKRFNPVWKVGTEHVMNNIIV